jgi:hypothetical protein
MTLDAVVERISRLPVDFYGGSKSMVQLISESEVARFPLAQSVQCICTYIAAKVTVMQELIFEVTQEADGGFVAESPGEGVITQADT